MSRNENTTPVYTYVNTAIEQDLNRLNLFHDKNKERKKKRDTVLVMEQNVKTFFT